METRHKVYIVSAITALTGGYMMGNTIEPTKPIAIGVLLICFGMVGCGYYLSMSKTIKGSE